MGTDKKDLRPSLLPPFGWARQPCSEFWPDDEAIMITDRSDSRMLFSNARRGATKHLAH